MRASRLVSLLLLLQHRGRLTAGELAETLEVSVRTPNEPDHVIKVVDLAANEFRQLDSLLSNNTFDARISVRAIAGEGRAIAYVSLVDKKSGDPTYIPGQ